jgi:hypothetical protein
MPITKSSVRRRSQAIAILMFATIISGWRAFGAEEEIDPSALPPPANRKIDFNRDVAPILRERCQSCHGPEKEMAGLRLDNRTDALKGGDSGPVIRPGDSGKSKLIYAVSGLGKGLVMPFASERLTAEQVGVLRAWIDQGAEWPVAPKASTSRPTREK